MAISDLIALSLSVFNLLRLGFYVPQIVAVARDRHGATPVSLLCWMIWIGANASTALYAGVNIGDTRLCLINAFNATCCAIVLLIAACKRARAPVTSAPIGKAESCCPPPGSSARPSRGQSSGRA